VRSRENFATNATVQANVLSNRTVSSSN
jgi:hypothetical protein